MINGFVNIRVGPSTDFIVGEHSFDSLEIRNGNTGNGFYYFYDNEGNRLIKHFVLETSSSGIKTSCAVTFIEKDGRFSPRLEFSKRKRDVLQQELITIDGETKNISSRVDMGECHTNFWALVDYIQSLKKVDVPRSGLVAVSKTDREFLKRIEINKDFIDKVLSSFSSVEAQNLLVQAKKDDVNNLFASVKQAKNKKALEEIKNLVLDEAGEHTLELWIKENDWVFGIEYIRRLDATKIGLHSDADLLVESLDGFIDIIELKKASVPLLRYDSSHRCYYPSSDLSEVIGQAIHYLGILEDQRLILRSEDGLNVLKPRAKIVIGQSSKMNDLERQSLRKLNDTLHNIDILSYDEIKSRAERLVSLYTDDNAKTDAI